MFIHYILNHFNSFVKRNSNLFLIFMKTNKKLLKIQLIFKLICRHIKHLKILIYTNGYKTRRFCDLLLNFSTLISYLFINSQKMHKEMKKQRMYKTIYSIFCCFIPRKLYTMYKYPIYENVFSAQFTKNSVSQIRHRNAEKMQTLLVKMLYNGNRWCNSLCKNLQNAEKRKIHIVLN